MNNIVYIIIEKEEEKSSIKTVNINVFNEEENAVKYYETLLKKKTLTWKSYGYDFEKIIYNTYFRLSYNDKIIEVSLQKNKIEDYVPKQTNIAVEDVLVDIVVEEVCNVFHIPKTALISESKIEDHKLARFATVNILLSQAVSTSTIGMLLGRTKSAIYNSRDRAEDELSMSKYFKNKILVAVNNIAIRLGEKGLDFKHPLL